LCTRGSDRKEIAVKTRIFLVMLMGVLVIPTNGNPRLPYAEAYFSSGTVVPPTDSGGWGRMVIDVLGFSYLTQVYEMLEDSTTSLVICRGGPGVNGPIVRTIFSGYFPPDTTIYGLDWLPDHSDLVAGRLYALICTKAHPDGEIRGQLIGYPGSPATLTTWGLIKSVYR
jgi:hypothetical protein